MTEKEKVLLQREAALKTIRHFSMRDTRAVDRAEVEELFPLPKVPRVFMRGDGIQFRLQDGRWHMRSISAGRSVAREEWLTLAEGWPICYTRADCEGSLFVADHPFEEE